MWLFVCRVTIASHPEYREWVEGFGIGYKDVGGDPGALMKLSVEHRMFSPGFFKESLGHFRKWLDDLVSEGTGDKSASVASRAKNWDFLCKSVPRKLGRLSRR